MADKRNPRSTRSAICSKNPWKSNSMGVHPKDIPNAIEAVKKQGGRFGFDNKGFVVADTQAGRNDALRFFGMGDRDAGYGDHTG